MNYKPIIVLLFACFFTISCAEKKESEEKSETPETPMESLIDGNWELIYIMNGSEPLDEMFPEGRATLTIDSENSRINGNAGCNVYNGSFSKEGDGFKVLEPMAVTRKMCMEMSGEDLFLKAMSQVDGYKLRDEGKGLDLLSGDAVILKFMRK